MKEIHKIAAMVIEDNKFLMVRKVGKTTWTNLGGRPEAGESEIETLLREIQEEIHCDATIIRKLGVFRSPAAHDHAIVVLSTYLVRLNGRIRLDDPELEEYRFVPSNYEEQNIKLPTSITDHVIPYCIKEGLLDW